MLSLLFSVLVATFTATPSVNAAPFEKRGMAQVISQCYHGFAYTWDDGPYTSHTAVQSAFDNVGGKTTFFANGDNWSCIYDQANVDRLRASFSAGHQIASHTWSHRNLVTLSEAEIDYEIQRLDEAFIKILGVKPKFMRPPYGAIDERTSSYIQNRHGKTIVLWSDDSGDSTGGNAQSSYNFYNNFANAGPSVQPRMTLSHETSAGGIGALNMGTVGRLASAGMNLITVAQCLNTDAYEYYGGFGNRDSSWYCGGGWTPSNPTPTSTTTPTPTQTCVATIRSQERDTCDSIGQAWGLSGQAIWEANRFLTCTDIWVNTPICIPPGGSTTTSTSTSTATQPCVTTIRSQERDTCDSIGQSWGLSGQAIWEANRFLTCTDIWVNTPICIPPGGVTQTSTSTSTSTSTPPTPSCVQTYTSQDQDTCESLDIHFGLPSGSIFGANQFLTCTDIWVNTPICVPPGGRDCTLTIRSTAGETCNDIGEDYGVSGTQIWRWNTFLNCNDIWPNTPVCVRH